MSFLHFALWKKTKCKGDLACFDAKEHSWPWCDPSKEEKYNFGGRKRKGKLSRKWRFHKMKDMDIGGMGHRGNDHQASFAFSKHSNYIFSLWILVLLVCLLVFQLETSCLLNPATVPEFVV